jgi:hypothetical protein
MNDNTSPVLKLPFFHKDQHRAFEVQRRQRFFALRAGRRWGKTDFDKILISDSMAKGRRCGFFAPDYKTLSGAYDELAEVLEPITRTSAKQLGVMTFTTGGKLDFWTLENERAGRSRKYHGVIIDEGAFTKPNMMAIWERSIRPTLLDYKGWAVVSSNTNGVDPDNFFWQICNEPKHGFVEYHAPTHRNPFLPKEELAKLKADNHPLVYKQEYLAEFVDWSGIAFFSLDSLLELGLPVAYPAGCDAVFATIDTATKTGRENDGTAVCYWALTRLGLGPHPLVLLDWDVVQIEGSLLETWLPTVFQHLEALAGQCRARAGSVGTWIEDKSSGMVLLQQANRRGWPAQPIDSKLTSVGKVERCISVSGYIYRGMVKLSKLAHDKVVTYKGTTRNHLLSQDPNRADDALDAFVYGVAVGLGGAEGF